MPFPVEVVKGVLERGGVAPVVLRGNGQESVVALYERAPGAGVLVPAQRGFEGFVQ
jgi:hypothetical protein